MADAPYTNAQMERIIRLAQRAFPELPRGIEELSALCNDYLARGASSRFDEQLKARVFAHPRFWNAVEGFLLILALPGRDEDEG